MANICMTGKQAVNEHEHLVKVLRSGGKQALKREAGKQTGELKEYRAKNKKSNRLDSRK